MGTYLYVFSIALQLAGALLLIAKYWSKSVKRQLAVIRDNRTRVEKETLICGKNGPSDQEFVEELWMSRIAFIYIAVGYFIGVFGNANISHRFIAGLSVIIVAVILGVLAKVIAKAFSKTYHN